MTGIDNKGILIMILVYNVEKNFFDENSIIENYILGDQYLIKAMIDNNYTSYLFLNKFIVCKNYKCLKISSI